MAILWVEDEIDQFISFSFATDKKYKIDSTSSLKDANEKITIFTYELIIVDIIIPIGEDNLTIDEIISSRKKYFGLDLIKNIRRSTNNSTTPIIVLTVVRDKETINEIKKIDQNINVYWKYDTDAISVNKIIENIISK